MPKTPDMRDQRFGRLVVLEQIIENGKNSRWLCQCDCGNKTITGRPNLIQKKSFSCGCYNSEKTKEYFTQHGMTETKTYKAWEYMKTRCLNEKCKSYKNYGERGITICEQWRNSFENFIQDMGERPDGYSLERINNNLGYSKENCKWIPRGHQSKNRRGCLTRKEVEEVREMLEQRKYPQVEIAKKFNVTPSCISCLKKGKTWLS